MYGEGRPRLDLEYPICEAFELPNEEAFTSVVVLTTSFPSGFDQAGIKPTTFPLEDAPPTDVSAFTARPWLWIGSHEFYAHMEVDRDADTNLLLPHVSVTSFMSDSTSKPSISRVTEDANLPALGLGFGTYPNHVPD